MDKTTTPPGERLLSLAEAAAYIGVSRDVFRRLPVPSVPIGGRRRYRQATLDNWIREQEEKP